jgi:septal ring-binding cell division protein DamX
VYLFEKNISPLQMQKNNRELEVIVQECIMIAIRDSIPTEAIIRAYMDEATEHEEEIFIENIEDLDADKVEETVTNDSHTKASSQLDNNLPPVVPSIKNTDDEPVTTRLTFNTMDTVLDNSIVKKENEAPVSLERLEETATSSAIQRTLEEDPSDDKIQIYNDQSFDLSEFDVLDEIKSKKPSDDFLLDDIEVL